MNYIQRFLVTAYFILLPSFCVAAGMKTQMDNILQEMSAYTPPGSYETQRRSAYYGGRYTMKSRIFNENLVSMTPPSARGGCGGIDVYGGSFSFVSNDKITELMRAVASNAKGYAFQLAMDNMCADCIKWMNELQSKIQSLNDNLSNSCQLAKGIVNTGMDAVRGKDLKDWEIVGVGKGVVDDFAAAGKHIGTAGSVVSKMFENKPEEANEMTGNIAYKAMKKHNMKTWISGGDDLLLEQIMSMTGSIVITGAKDAEGLATNYSGGAKTAPIADKTTDIVILPGGSLRLEDLMYGKADVQIYNCSADTQTTNCRIDPSMSNYRKKVTIEGFEKRLVDIFNADDGIIELMHRPAGSAVLSDQHKSILAAMPGAIGSKIFTIGPRDKEAAKSFVEKYAGRFALEILKGMVDQSFVAVQDAMAATPNAYEQQVKEVIVASRKNVNDEYRQLSTTKGYPTIAEIDEKYQILLQVLPEIKLGSNEHRGGVN